VTATSEASRPAPGEPGGPRCPQRSGAGCPLEPAHLDREKALASAARGNLTPGPPRLRTGGRMGQTDSLELHTELEDLHATALRLVLLAVAALAVYGDFGFTAFADRVDATGFGLMWAVLATAALAFWVMRHGVALAAALLVRSARPSGGRPDRVAGEPHARRGHDRRPGGGPGRR